MRAHQTFGGRTFQTEPFAFAWASMTCFAHTLCNLRDVRYRVYSGRREPWLCAHSGGSSVRPAVSTERACGWELVTTFTFGLLLSLTT